MRYTLRDVGLSAYKKIMRGRKWVGRVGRVCNPVAPSSEWFGKIGSTYVYAATERAAFDLVVAKHLGFESVAALDNQNRRVRGMRRQRRAAARAVADQWLAGNYEPLYELLSRMDEQGQS